MIMDKVKVNRNVAEAIEFAKDKLTNEHIIECHINKKDKWVNKSEPLKSIDLDTLIKAIYIGYDVKVDPHESILHYFKQAEKEANSNDYDSKFTGEAKIEAVRYVLNKLNVKIDGIN